MLTFVAEITSRSLSIPVISKAQIDRLNLIKKLHLQGLSDTSIANYLNSKGIKTPKGKKYYQELVWVTRNKFEKRNIRKTDFKYEIKNINFLIKT